MAENEAVVQRILAVSVVCFCYSWPCLLDIGGERSSFALLWF